MIPLVVGIDPGSELSAFVAVTPAPAGRVALVRSAMLPANLDAAIAWLDELARVGRIDAVGIEWAEGFVYDKFRGPPLLVSQGVAGEYSGYARGRGMRVVKISCAGWRKSVIGTLKTGPRGAPKKDHPWDDRVAETMPAFVTGTGTLGGNSHLLDACGVAVYASRLTWRRRAA